MITLGTLKDATAQEVFNQAAKHLLTQNKRSFDADIDYCMYRSKEGLKCAAGCFISDEEYNPEFERTNITAALMNYNFDMTHQHLIQELQKIHDNFEPEEWEAQLKRLATEKQLVFEVIM